MNLTVCSLVPCSSWLIRSDPKEWLIGWGGCWSERGAIDFVADGGAALPEEASLRLHQVINKLIKYGRSWQPSSRVS